MEKRVNDRENRIFKTLKERLTQTVLNSLGFISVYKQIAVVVEYKIFVCSRNFDLFKEQHRI